MGYNAITDQPLIMTNGITPTPAQNARDIASLTAAVRELTQSASQLSKVSSSHSGKLDTLTTAVDVVVTEFVRPTLQQANANRETLDKVIKALDGHANAILQIDQRLEAVTTQLASASKTLTAFDKKLTETRELVAENASQIAQLGVKQKENASQIAQLGVKQKENAEAIAANAKQIAQLGVKQKENAEVIAANAKQVEALAEASRTQLAAIIGNGRRIDRLEQQAS